MQRIQFDAEMFDILYSDYCMYLSQKELLYSFMANHSFLRNPL